MNSVRIYRKGAIPNIVRDICSGSSLKRGFIPVPAPQRTRKLELGITSSPCISLESVFPHPRQFLWYGGDGWDGPKFPSTRLIFDLGSTKPKVKRVTGYTFNPHDLCFQIFQISGVV